MAKKKRKSSLGVIFWLALLLFLVVLYAANKVNLTDALGSSGVSGFLRDNFGGNYQNPRAGAENAEPSVREAPRETPARPDAPPVPPYINPPPPRPPVVSETPPPAPRTPAQPPRETAPPAVPARPPQDSPAAPPPPAPAAQAPAQPPRETAPPPAAAQPARGASLYFVRLTEAGDVLLVKAAREIPSGGAPLRETLQALLKGPSPREKEEGCASLIPQDSRLLSASVENGVAFVSFNENFRFNAFGKEGYDGQLRQTVYTITEFPNIRAVQILINGAKIDYLGTEGIFIGNPVGRKELETKLKG